MRLHVIQIDHSEYNIFPQRLPGHAPVTRFLAIWATPSRSDLVEQNDHYHFLGKLVLVALATGSDLPPWAKFLTRDEIF